MQVTAGLNSKLKGMGRNPWGVEVEVCDKVSKREVNWKLTKVPRDIRDSEAVEWLMEQIITLMKTAQKGWVSRPQAVRVVVRFLVGSDKLSEIEVEAQLSKENPKTRWGDRDWIRMVYNDWEVEVATAAEAERIIKEGMMWQGKKVRVCSEAGYAKAVPSKIVKNRDGEMEEEKKRNEKGTKPAQQTQSPTKWRQGEHQTGQPTRSRQVATKDTTCYKCQGRGHLSYDCRNAYRPRPKSLPQGQKRQPRTHEEEKQNKRQREEMEKPKETAPRIVKLDTSEEPVVSDWDTLTDSSKKEAKGKGKESAGWTSESSGSGTTKKVNEW
jgi:hypothetical protein